MKTIRFIFLSLLILSIQPAFAADDHSLLSGETMNYIGYGAIMIALVVLIVAMLTVLKAFKLVARLLLGPEAAVDAKADKAALKEARKAARADRLNRLLSLKPMSEEKSLLIEHDYDGIQELDNPTPAWFMYLFYVTIAFAIGYLLIYHVFDAAPLQYDEYKNEMAVAAKEKAAYLAKVGNMVDENTVKLTTDVAVLSSGQDIFKSRCIACHGDHGQGNVGPNLTDDYWLHGNKINEIFKTIKYGVASKGMPTWETQLSPKQISDVANYVKSIHGSNPANPKEPQGDKIVDDGAAKPATPAPKTAALIK
ncbi:cbb3-type cytochrome c oxidase N-terminal domain-containing protein [Mucilaginibacter ginsenosidivorans]|uniref:C-type cytochrome n=1 Tax=Mucilaginibacter ginsenosidivorans TaxID=398053 RepID=A0A5B8UTB5_9SPHI|nr:cbb3-type cytochrome c oxidase N-terminal domain-containing protein [Mucilaginibacter ginsenosidivorans]QEC62132.1 c-type cytochrome [Mucilaginibacter ginsenosidivorans]